MVHVPLGFAVEADLLAVMDCWLPLPDEGDSGWDEDGWAWPATERLLAAADLCGEKGWRRGARIVFEHAADWDIHGAMRGILTARNVHSRTLQRRWPANRSR